MMAWSINFNPDARVIELTYSGQVTAADLNDAFDAAMAMAMKEMTGKVLADCTNMILGHSIFDLYALIEIFSSKDLRGLREALLLPASQASKKGVEFYETACLNRGFDVKIFSDHQAAMDWLAK